MKQTNNAIKFLMAQYRAIFKNANIAMVAAMAAAALAAGQAQAKTDAWANLSGRETISADTTYSGGASNENANGFDLTITSGTLTFKGDTTAGNFSMSGDKTGKITLNGDKAAIKIGGDGVSGAAVKVTSFTGSAGSLTIGGSEQASSLEAATILLQGSTPEAPAKAGEATFPMTVTLAKSGALGGANSAITVATGAKIVMGESTEGASIAGKSLTLNGGVLTVNGAKDFKISSQKVEVKTGSEFTIGTGTVTFDKATDITFAAETLTNGGTIALGEVSDTRNVNLKVDAKTFNEQLFKDTRKVSVSGNSNNAGTLTIEATGKEVVNLVESGLFAEAGKIDTTAGLVSGGTAGNINVTVKGKDGTLAATTLVDSSIGKVNLEFDTLTIGKGADFELKNAKNAVTVNKGLIVSGSKALTLVNGGTLNLDGENGTVTAKSITVGKDSTSGTLNIKNGTWNIPSLTMHSGNAVIEKATVTLQKDAVLTTKNNDNKLTLTSSTLDVTSGKVQLAESGAALNTGSKLSIAKDQLFTASGDVATLTADTSKNKVVQNSLATDGTGVLEIMNAGNVSADLANDLMNKLGYKGFIQFGGKSTISPSKKETVNFSEAGDMTILGVYDKTQVVMDSDNNIDKSLAAGSIKLHEADDTGVVKNQSLILSNAGTGGGKFVQNSDGTKVGGLQLSGA
uniref:hypothetical protein n=1 Tax=Anaerobiospirillum succiniciproducens TaxID=13335 RepID=UPI0005C522CE